MDAATLSGHSLQQQQQHHQQQHHHQQQQQMLQMMMSRHAGMMDPSSNAFITIQLDTEQTEEQREQPTTAQTTSSWKSIRFLQIQQIQRRFRRVFDQRAERTTPFPWPPVGSPFPTFPAAGMSGARYQIDNAAAPPLLRRLFW